MILTALVLARHLFCFLTLLNSAQEVAIQLHWGPEFCFLPFNWTVFLGSPLDGHSEKESPA